MRKLLHWRVLCALLACSLGWQSWRLREVRDAAEEKLVEQREQTALAQQEVKRLQEQQGKRESFGKRTAGTTGTSGETEGAQAKQSRKQQRREADPMVQALTKEMLAVELRRAYADLESVTGIQGETLAALLELLLQRNMANWNTDGATPLTAAEMTARDQQAVDDLMQRARSLLTPDQYAAFEHYEKLGPFRGFVRNLAKLFPPGLKPLQFDQQNALAQIMYEQETAYQERVAPQQRNRPMLSEENLQLFIKQREELLQRTYDRARVILTPEQLTMFMQLQEEETHSRVLQWKRFQAQEEQR